MVFVRQGVLRFGWVGMLTVEYNGGVREKKYSDLVWIGISP